MSAEEPYAMGAEHWELLQEVLADKIEELDIDPSNVPRVFDLVREYWLILNDIPALRAYADVIKLQKLVAVRANLDIERPALDAEIAALEAALGQ